VSAPAFDQATGTLVCLFELASRTFAVDIGRTKEARVLDDYTVVPLGPPHLVGMTNLRGAIIPIVDLRVLLDGQACGATGHVLLVEANGVRVALAVDRVLGVETLDEPLDPGEDVIETAGLERGRLRRGAEAVPILDIVKIVNSLT
jgi:chemotaxis signal transduction protein